MSLPEKTPDPPPSNNQEADEFADTLSNRKGKVPSALARRLLVFYKKYPNMESIPPTVRYVLHDVDMSLEYLRTLIPSHSATMLKKLQDKARIHLNLVLIGVFSVLLMGSAIRGKRAFQSGHSITDMNMEWHKRYNETGVIGDIRDEGQGNPEAIRK